ncbi:MAG: DNA repair protein RecN [Solirubrobacterales bacterium]
MLREIYIKNFILIDEIRLEFLNGLNVLTGETGAGKSIVIDALELLFGERISAELTRSNTEKSIIEGVLDCRPESGACAYLAASGIICEDETLIIRREISPQGRVVNRINGQNVTAGLLKGLAAFLIDIHLQHDTQQILDPATHLGLLDSFAPETAAALQSVTRTFDAMRAIEQRIAALETAEGQRTRELEFLLYQVDEIEKAKLIPGEEEELSLERHRMRNASRLGQSADLIQELAYRGSQSAFDQIAQAIDAARAAKDDFFEAIEKQLQEASFLLEEVGDRVASFANELEFEPGRLEIVEERLHQIERLKKKYGPTEAEILAFLDASKVRAEALSNLDHDLETLKSDLEPARNAYLECAAALTGMRNEAASHMEARVRNELETLAMPGVMFQIGLTVSEPARNGMDTVTFLFSANPGEVPKPLAKIASGGELSRFILALKAAASEIYPVPTMVFDEIDVGVGGQALLLMAGKIKKIADNHQVVLITHSPQVAALADHHLVIRKHVTEISTTVDVETLPKERRAEELARMLAGEQVTETVMEHARQMLSRAALS